MPSTWSIVSLSKSLFAPDSSSFELTGSKVTIASIFPSLKLETIENYQSFNATRTFIEDKFNLSIDYQMISPSKIFDSSQHLFPVIDFTNVAFDRLYRQSLVYFSIRYSLGGYGRFLYLEKDGENWIIKKVSYIWSLR